MYSGSLGSIPSLATRDGESHVLGSLLWVSRFSLQCYWVAFRAIVFLGQYRMMWLVLEDGLSVLPFMQLQSSSHTYSKTPKNSWKVHHLPFQTSHPTSLMSPNYPHPLAVHWALKLLGGQPALCYTWQIHWTTRHKSSSSLHSKIAHILC